MNPFESYHLFLSLKQHFNRDSYDFFKFNGKTNASVSSFNSRKDKYFYYKLSKTSDPRGLILSNILENNKLWVKDLFSDSARSIYAQWKSRTESFSYVFTNEISDLTRDKLVVKNGQHPKLLTNYIRGKVSHETMIVLNQFGKFFSLWNENITDNVVWPDIYKKLNKYQPFVKYNPIKCKKILVDALEENK